MIVEENGLLKAIEREGVLEKDKILNKARSDAKKIIDRAHIIAEEVLSKSPTVHLPASSDEGWVEACKALAAKYEESKSRVRARALEKLNGIEPGERLEVLTSFLEELFCRLPKGRYIVYAPKGVFARVKGDHGHSLERRIVEGEEISITSGDGKHKIICSLQTALDARLKEWRSPIQTEIFGE